MSNNLNIRKNKRVHLKPSRYPLDLITFTHYYIAQAEDK